MNLSTSRIVLKPLSPADYKDIHEMNSFWEVARYNTIGIPKDLSETTARLDEVSGKESAFVWVIRNLETNDFIGEIGINLSSEKYRKGEIYYNLNPGVWGLGYATEAVQTLINYAFGELNLHRIEAGVATENVRSIALLERVGMTREGLCRKILPLQSGWMDNYMYAILQEDSREY